METLLREFIGISGEETFHYTEVEPGEFVIHSLALALRWHTEKGETFAETIRRYHAKRGGYMLVTRAEMEKSSITVLEVK